MDFGKDALHSDIQCEFFREYYTRTYSTIFDFILHSNVQYDFWSSSSTSKGFKYCVWKAGNKRKVLKSFWFCVFGLCFAETKTKKRKIKPKLWFWASFCVVENEIENGFCDFSLLGFLSRFRIAKSPALLLGLKMLFALYRVSKKTLDRVCKLQEIDSISASNKMINPVLFSKLKIKIGNYLISEPIRNEINEFYFSKNTEKSKTAWFLSDWEAEILIEILGFRS